MSGLPVSTRPLTDVDLADAEPGTVIVAFDFTDPIAAVKLTPNLWRVTGYKAPFFDPEIIEMGGEWEVVAVRRDGR